MNNIFINIYEKTFTYHWYYQKLFNQLVKKDILVYVFVKNTEDKELDEWVYQKTFTDKEELLKQIKELNFDNIYISTFEEHTISLVNEIKKHFNQAYTTHYKAFTNKDLQRQLLLQEDKNITTNFMETTLDSIDFEKIENKIDYPLVIKPVSAAQSRWVAIIKNRWELEKYIKDYSFILERISSQWYKNEKFLVEEFIDGTAWSVDYFVDDKWNFISWKPVFLEFGIDFWINDFCNITRVISQDKENILDFQILEEFIKKNINALGIKNTFVHHEFKLTSKWKLKTIELNGRIGWFRLQMYDTCYDINLLEFAFLVNENIQNYILQTSIKTNYSVWAGYPTKEGIFEWTNQKIIDEIKKLKSLEQIKVLEKKIWEKIWFAKNWFTKVGIIRINNKYLEQFNKDYSFIKENYFNLFKIS